MGAFYRPLGHRLLANFMKIAIYGCRWGDDPATCWPCCTSCSISTLWCRCWSCWGSFFSGVALRPLPLDPAGLLRTAAATAASALCVFATQTGNKLLGANIRYVDRAVNYHRDIIRAGPGLYLFNLVDEMLQSGNVFRYPCRSTSAPPS